jgi:hypothetical protein
MHECYKEKEITPLGATKETGIEMHINARKITYTVTSRQPKCSKR